MADANAPSKKKGGIKVGQYVWVKDAAIAGDSLYVKGLVKNIDDKGKVTVECYNESKSEELELPKDECYPPHPGEDVPDHCQLMFLSQATLLENTRVRFANDHIHTYVGDILVVVNPFKWDVQQAGHPVYSDAVKAMCVDKKLQTAGCGPHVFAMAEKAYVQLKTSVKKVGRLQSQCVVVSGESGAGKTEGNRALMNYLIYRGSAGGAPSDLTEKIMNANPILESFGNAKTTRNNNSSRFGRYTLVRFDDSWGVAGAQVRVFLLERSRVTSASNAQERSYHAFYQLIKAGTQYISPNDCKAHRYTAFPGTEIDSPGIDDAAWFKECNDGFASVAVGPSEIDVMWGYVAAMLLMGNLDFGQGDHAVVADAATLAKLEANLGITNGAQMLTKRSLTIAGETSLIEQEPAKAAMARDALVKIMYARLFDWIVSRVNKTVDASGDSSDRYIGLLDVYGFEFFAVNSFEQLCINFANEKLQQFFLVSVFASEANTYHEEGVPWTPIQYKDNSDIIALCEEKEKGIYDVLDNQCKTPKADGRTFCKALHDTHGQKKGGSAAFGKLKVGKKEKRSNDDHFIVCHFAGVSQPL
jgi:myosin heavy subunit